MAYKSPIEMVCDDMKISYENGVVKAVQAYDIKVDKAELLKALKYDRAQYDKGYKDALAENEVVKHGRWINSDEILCGHYINGRPVLMCSNCRTMAGRIEEAQMIITVPVPYCPFCGAKMDESEAEP